MTELLLADDLLETFFAPAATDQIDVLISMYNQEKKLIQQVADIVAGDLGGVIRYFLDGNQLRESGYSSYSAEKIFRLPGALACLDAYYWQKAIALTDVRDAMPQKRRSEWDEQIRDMKTPEFTEETVRSTLTHLLMSRSTFFAERVDGIFRSLSKSHVTNVPEGFSKRMIMEHVINEWGSVDWTRAGYINDLRCVIARFMGMEEPKHNASTKLLDILKRTPGEWAQIDGNSLKIKVFKKGTVHLEVHPDMAWRLNSVLASLYPAAIPSQFRSKPAKKPKDYVVMQKPLPYHVREALAGGKYFDATNNKRVVDRQTYDKRINSFTFDFYLKSSIPQVFNETVKVLESIGGVLNDTEIWFDYNARDVIDEIVTTGLIPDHKSHQYYPTPDWLAQRAVDWAEVEDHHACLEPSAGQGAILNELPNHNLQAVELSELNAKVLESKGYKVTQGDFIAWSQQTPLAFDRIVMNPPFSEGRAKAHTEAALSLLAPDGVLVAILPASFKGKDFPSYTCEWSEVISNAFAGTSVSVVMLKAINA